MPPKVGAMQIKTDFRTIDRYFADFICRESGLLSDELWLLSALASYALNQGDVCLDLYEIAGQEYLSFGKTVRLPDPVSLIKLLGKAGAVGVAEDFRPLILESSGRLYLHRYWKYEQDLARLLVARAASLDMPDRSQLISGLNELFKDNPAGEIDWQAVAAIAAIVKRFCIISGGPGTGKTSTVVKILALLIGQNPGRQLKIGMAAPTGKAAARLKDSIMKMKETLSCSDEIKRQIPVNVTTIHRLLGVIPSSTRFRFSSENRLPFDLVIVDEASMIDLPLISRLVTALKDDSRLILLGDRDQLSSVEAGAVLGDICGRGNSGVFTPDFCNLVNDCLNSGLESTESGEKNMPLADTLVILRKNYRFRPGSGIGELAAAVNSGDSAEALNLMLSRDYPDVVWQDTPDEYQLKALLEKHILQGYSDYLDSKTPQEALARFEQFRLLCAVREGPFGVAGINRFAEEILEEKGLIDIRNRWYRGRPVMITVNDYNIGLYNGDIGIFLHDSDASNTLRVCFSDNQGGIRFIAPARLPEHETVYAMTVHKSQGSEFDEVLLLLPGHQTAALCRELVYTGITRAKKVCSVWGDRDIFAAAVRKKNVRKSGLMDALW